jgi:hypothetical protein
MKLVLDTNSIEDYRKFLKIRGFVTRCWRLIGGWG